MEKRILSFLVLIVLMQCSFLVVHSPSSVEIDATTVVSQVIDGDTFDTTSEGTIRLADVDAPESVEYGYYDSKDFLVSLIDDKTVYLDIDDIYGTGYYGRLICVVYVNHNSTHYKNVNKALLVEGCAVIKDYDNEFNPYTWSLYVPKEEKPESPSLNVFLTLNPENVDSNADVSISVHVTDGTVIIGDACVQLVSDKACMHGCKGGSFASSSGYTDLNGDFSTTFTAPNVTEQTNVRITATASKSGHADGSDYEYVSVLPPGPPSFSVAVAANPSTLKLGESSTITVKVTIGVNPLFDATVTLSSDNGGTFSQESGNTDSNGAFICTFTAPSVTQQTTCTITAGATKEGYLGDQGQTQVTVKPPGVEGEEKGIELFWILIAVAVVSVGIVTAALIVCARGARRRRKEKGK